MVKAFGACKRPRDFVLEDFERAWWSFELRVEVRTLDGCQWYELKKGTANGSLSREHEFGLKDFLTPPRRIRWAEPKNDK